MFLVLIGRMLESDFLCVWCSHVRVCDLSLSNACVPGAHTLRAAAFFAGGRTLGLDAGEQRRGTVVAAD